MATGPLVSIITPAYNAATYISATARSVLAQTFTAWEWIVVDDGSTDATPELVTGFADPRIRLMQGGHSGLPAVARNRGLQAVRGELVAFLDADDVWAPEKLALQTAYLRAHPAAGLVFTAYRSWFERYRRLRQRPEPALGGLPNPGDLTVALYFQNLICTSSMLLRRELLTTYGGFDEDVRQRGTEDYELWLRLAPRTLVGFIAQPLVFYRVHPENLSHQWRPIAQGAALAREKLLRRYPDLGLHPALGATRVVAHRLRWAGIAALLDGDTASGMAALLQSVRHQPFQRETWLWLGLSCLGPSLNMRLRQVRHRFL
ncbi:MAG: glycosyltransferase [Chloroflexales bacterium]